MFGQHLKPRVVTVGVIRTATYLCCVRWLGDCSRAPILAYRNLITRQDTYGIACYQTMKGDTDEAVRGPGQRVVASPIRRSLRDLTVCRWDNVVKYLVRAGRVTRTNVPSSNLQASVPGRSKGVQLVCCCACASSSSWVRHVDPLRLVHVGCV